MKVYVSHFAYVVDGVADSRIVAITSNRLEAGDALLFCLEELRNLTEDDDEDWSLNIVCKGDRIEYDNQAGRIAVVEVIENEI